MVTLHNYDYLLWFCGTLIQASVLVALLRNGLRKNFPFFFNYTLFEIVASVVLYAVELRGPYSVYFYMYWAVSAVSFLLGFSVIYEIFQNTFRPFEALRDFAAALFRWATLVLVLVAAVIAFTSPAGESRAVVGVLSLERSVLVMQAGMLLFLLIFAARLGLTWKHHAFGIALGFGVYACAELVMGTLRAQMGSTWNALFISSHLFFYSLRVSVWLIYLALPEPARVTAQASFTPKPVLTRWNQALSTDQLALVPQDAFISNLEHLVDQVMEHDRR